MKFLLVLNLFLTLSLARFVTCQFCSQSEVNIDYKGFDIASSSNAVITTVDTCCQLCLVTPNCVAYTYYANTCWLKSSNAGRVPTTGRIATMFIIFFFYQLSYLEYFKVFLEP